VATQVVPGLADLADRIMPALGMSAVKVGKYGNRAEASLENVGNFLLNTVALKFPGARQQCVATLQTASETAAIRGDTKIQPASEVRATSSIRTCSSHSQTLGTGLSGLLAKR